MSGKVFGRGRLTEADHERIYRLAERGMKASAIARAIRRHPSTVQWFMYSEGLRAPARLERPLSFVRNGRTVYRFTDDEDVFIEALRVQDFTFAQIAAQASRRFGTHRSAHVIQCRLIMLAAREVA